MNPARAPALLALLALAGPAAAAEADFPPLPGLEQGRRVWLGTCVGCHGDGLAGAPAVGDRGAWAPRLAKGRATLLRHALEGFFGPDSSMMPARGGNDTLSDRDVGAALDYMLGLVARAPASPLLTTPR